MIAPSSAFSFRLHDQRAHRLEWILSLPVLASALNQRLGSALLFCGWPLGAAQAFRDAARIAPVMAEAHFGLGEALARRCRWREAASAFREAARLAPHSVEARGNLVIALWHGRLPADAIRALHDLSRLRPDQAELHLLRGALLLEMRRPAEAIAALRWAARLPAPAETARFFLGEALLGDERWRAAAASLRAARAQVCGEPVRPPARLGGDLNRSPAAIVTRRSPRAPGVNRIARVLALGRRVAGASRGARRGLERVTRRLFGGAQVLLGFVLASRSPHRAIRALRHGVRLRTAG
jgi:Flp pilus assembly protein TadD